jgi:hypothetical protein
MVSLPDLLERKSISVLLRLTTIDVVDEVVVVELMRHKMIGVCFEAGEKDLEVSLILACGLWRITFIARLALQFPANLVSPGVR